MSPYCCVPVLPAAGRPGTGPCASTTSASTVVTALATFSGSTRTRRGMAVYRLPPSSPRTDSTKCRSARIPPAANVAYTVARSAGVTG